MTPPDIDRNNAAAHLDSWVANKRRRTAPPNFADQLLSRLPGVAPPTARFSLARLGIWAQAALFLIALIGGLGRYAVLILTLLVP